MSSKFRVPSYRLHKASNQAVVVLDGKSFYLGRYGTPASKDEYKRITSEWLNNRRIVPPSPTSPGQPPPLPVSSLTIQDLILVYWRFVQDYYVKNGEPTSEQDTIRQALRFLRAMYGPTHARDFGPLALKSIRQAMIDHPVTRHIKIKDKTTGIVSEEVRVLHQGLSRRHINKQIGRIKRMFSWAVENELMPIDVYRALAQVKGLRKELFPLLRRFPDGRR